MTARFAEEFCLVAKDDCLSIEVTTHCNGNCTHCFARAGNWQPSSLSSAVVKDVIMEGYKTGSRQLHITGGEPLLWKGLFGALDYAIGIGYQKISMNTNGKLITGDVAKKLVAYDGLSISVSLDGPESLHDCRRGAGAYKFAVRGIERALEAGVDLVIFTVAGKSLLPVLPRFVEEVYERFAAIKYLTLIQLLTPTDNEFALSEELLGPGDFIGLVQTVSLLNVYGLRTNVKHSPLARLVAKLTGLPWLPPAYPLYREGSLIVMANGNIRLSHSSRDGLGHYAPGMIQKVLSSDDYRSAVAPDQSVCPSCKHIALCRENGMLHPAARCFDTFIDVPYCRRVLDKVGGSTASAIGLFMPTES
jgi:MoaA/NifB/PqqE/SkfB family radical SAM enzyme